MTLPQVRAADWSHLLDAAQHWNHTAQTWEQTWHQALNAVGNAWWTGTGQLSAVQAHSADWAIALSHAEALRGAAGAAATGHDNLMAMRAALLDAVDQTTQQGYQVSEDFTVTPPPTMPSWMAVVVAPDIIARTTELQTRNAALQAYDADVASQISQPAAQFAATGFKTDGDNASDIAPPDVPDQPKLPTPPNMTVLPPGPPFDKSDDSGMPAEQNPQVGDLLSAAGMGCLGGAAIGSMIAGPLLPADVVTVPGGCEAGAIGGVGVQLGKTWVNNLIDGQG
jgi:hypothetical protein